MDSETFLHSETFLPDRLVFDRQRSTLAIQATNDHTSEGFRFVSEDFIIDWDRSMCSVNIIHDLEHLLKRDGLIRPYVNQYPRTIMVHLHLALKASAYSLGIPGEVEWPEQVEGPMILLGQG